MKLIFQPALRLLLLAVFCCFHFAVSANAKLLISTNKTFYRPSETMQFQVLMLNPSEKINNTLFIELLDCYGNKLASQMLPFDAFVSSGYLKLPDSVKQDFFLLHCYVRNADSVESSSIRKIPIGFAGAEQKKAGTAIRVTHFFEGGSFVSESPNNILVRSVDEFANPVVVKGKITDGKGGIYAVFETNEFGFAKVIMNPETNVRYFIEVKDKDNREDVSPIRIAAPAGITLNAANAGDSINYTIISYSAKGATLAEYRVEALHNGEILYDATLNFQDELSAVQETLKADLLPAGFILFRVVDRSNKIHARRVIYNPGKAVADNFITVVDSVNRKEARIMLPALVSGKSFIKVKTSGQDNSDRNDTDFIALAENFPVNDQLIAASEVPMSVNGTDQRTNRYLSIKGVMTDFEKKPVKNKNVNLVIMHKNLKKQFLVTKTDAEGKLQVDNLVFYDSVTVYYQLADKSEGKNDVLLDLTVSPVAAPVQVTKASFDLYCANKKEIEDNSRNNVMAQEKTLNQVIVASGKAKSDSEKFEEENVSGQMKRSQFLRNEIDLIENPETIDNRPLFTYIQSRIPSIKVFINATGAPVLQALNGGTVGVYLNDQELPLGESLGFLSNLLVRDVAQVKYYSMSFKPKIIGGNPLTDARAADGGDLLIYTKNNFVPDDKTKGLPKTRILGYDVEKPVAISNTNTNGSLFWKPDWKVESGQRIFINLPAGAEKNTEIVIEGINTHMMPYRFTQKLVFN